MLTHLQKLKLRLYNLPSLDFPHGSWDDRVDKDAGKDVNVSVKEGVGEDVDGGRVDTTHEPEPTAVIMSLFTSCPSGEFNSIEFLIETISISQSTTWRFHDGDSEGSLTMGRDTIGPNERLGHLLYISTNLEY